MTTLLAAGIDVTGAVSPALGQIGTAIATTVGGALAVGGGLLALHVAWKVAKRFVSTSFSSDSDYGGWSSPRGHSNEAEFS